MAPGALDVVNNNRLQFACHWRLACAGSANQPRLGAWQMTPLVALGEECTLVEGDFHMGANTHWVGALLTPFVAGVAHERAERLGFHLLALAEHALERLLQIILRIGGSSPQEALDDPCCALVELVSTRVAQHHTLAKAGQGPLLEGLSLRLLAPAP